MNKTPVVDLHCDLLSYLAVVTGANPYKEDEIGAAVPHLTAGQVKWQVMAVYTDTKRGSTVLAKRQVDLYKGLGAATAGFFRRFDFSAPMDRKWLVQNQCQTQLAIENASGFCEEGEPLDQGLKRLDAITRQCGPVAYIVITHHYENRFGGGNYTDIGLKPDGERLLEYLHGKKIPVDLAHTSDKLAFGILNHIERKGLNVPILASHSNFRGLHDHPRNLPDELAAQLIRKQGLIGINFLRNYINHNRPEALYEHIAYGVTMGASHLLAFGADFFYPLHHPDPSRYPIYFPGQDNASVYPEILSGLLARGYTKTFCDDIAHNNTMNYYSKLYGND